ncbi:6-phosphogluconolactonase [Oricola sp.]|uniref:6-phosphogluconolactonase n=1 Tax=Oricola sp. TaxID=1979950 RepID=UPI003BAC5B0D
MKADSGMKADAGMIRRHDYPDRDALAVALAAGLAATLAGAIAERGEASLAVSGGSTPKKLFDVLSQTDIAWDRVTVILVDERIVEAGDARANQRLVRERLLLNHASRAHFVPFETALPTPAENAARSAELFAGVPWPLDAAILGMGADGHTASFFPGGDRLAEAVDPAGTARVVTMQAEGAGEPRLTLTLPPLMQARFLALHIEGEEKRRVFDDALAGDDTQAMPVRAVLAQDAQPVHVFWAP